MQSMPYKVGPMNTLRYIAKYEKIVFLSFILFAVLSYFNWGPHNVPVLAVYALLAGVFVVMSGGVFNVVKHADVLAEKFGEPYGTLILTLSVIIIEVALIITVMLTGHAEATLARDTIFSVFMIAVNGFAGVSVFIGGLRHRAQCYNIQGANTYLVVLIPLAFICLIMPNYTHTAATGEFSIINGIAVASICIILYLAFLLMQTVTHVDYFKLDSLHEDELHDAKSCLAKGLPFHIIFLVISLIGMIVLSKKLALYLDFSLNNAGWPKSIGGVMIALIILLPEGYSAIKSAYRNDLQRSVNLCLGSALATVCLTVPAVLLICVYSAHRVMLGLNPIDSSLLCLTLLLSIISFNGGRNTNFMNGAANIAVFLLYLFFQFK